MLETSYSSLDLHCRNCQARWETPVARLVNVKTHPDGRLGILLGTMHRPSCPVCRTPHDPEPIFDYYDPDQQLVVQVRPAWEFHAGGGEDWYWARYEDLVERYADVDVRVDVVFGYQEMIDKYLGGQAAVETAQAEWATRQQRAREAAEAEARAWAAQVTVDPDEPEA